MNRMTGWLGAVGLALLLNQPMQAQQPLPEKGAPRQREPYFTPTRPLTSMSFSGRELMDHFNRSLSRFRLLLILSPSDEEDLRDAAAVERLLQQNSEGNWSVLAVWTAAKPTDSLASSLRATSVLSDPRVEHFHDASGSIARAFALRLGYPQDEPARGLFLGYPSGLSWDGLAPRPSFWMHGRAGLQQGKLFSVAELERLAPSGK